MRVLLIEGDPDIATILVTICELVPVACTIVTSIQEEELLAGHADPDDILFIDCSSASLSILERCLHIIRQITIPTYFIHPQEASVVALAAQARGHVTWLDPNFRALTLVQQLRLHRVITSMQRVDLVDADTKPSTLLPAMARHTATSTIIDIPSNSVSPTFSRREQQIHHLIASGYADKEIAARMNIQPGTVKTYVARLKDKLNLERRTELVAAYYQIYEQKQAVRESNDGRFRSARASRPLNGTST